MAIDNNYLQIQIMTQIQQSDNFTKSLKLAALKDDGIISKDEQKIISAVEKETEKYVKHLKKLLE